VHVLYLLSASDVNLVFVVRFRVPSSRSIRSWSTRHLFAPRLEVRVSGIHFNLLHFHYNKINPEGKPMVGAGRPSSLLAVATFKVKSLRLPLRPFISILSYLYSSLSVLPYSASLKNERLTSNWYSLGPKNVISWKPSISLSIQHLNKDPVTANVHILCQKEWLSVVHPASELSNSPIFYDAYTFNYHGSTNSNPINLPWSRIEPSLRLKDGLRQCSTSTDRLFVTDAIASQIHISLLGIYFI